MRAEDLAMLYLNKGPRGIVDLMMGMNRGLADALEGIMTETEAGERCNVRGMTLSELIAWLRTPAAISRDRHTCLCGVEALAMEHPEGWCKRGYELYQEL